MAAQKTVFTMLVAILLLEFGSLTKLQQIWRLAFQAEETGTRFQPKPNSGSNQGEQQPSPPVVQL